jgi:dTDP-4-dehydrorhamnose reductase
MPPLILMTGGAGSLATALRRGLPASAGADWVYTYHRRQPEASAAAFHHLDITDHTAVCSLFGVLRPTVVLHAAATMDPSAFDRAIVLGSANVARAAAGIGAVLLHVSSDMVFDGRCAPYRESAPLSPLTAYGRAKARAETEVLAACPDTLIIRTSLLYSLSPVDPRTGRDIDRLAAGEEVVLFTDERRSAAEVHDVADAIAKLAMEVSANRSRLDAAGRERIVHLAGPHALTRWLLGTSLIDVLGVPRRRLRAGTIAASGLTRPADLTLEAVATPPLWRDSIRSLSQVIEDYRQGRP